MKFDKSCLEFEVTSLDEVKLLLKSWARVLTRFQELKERVYRLTKYHLVNVSLEDRQGPVDMVILQFMAPQHLLDRLIDDLRSQGLECPMEVLVPGFIAKCRLQKKLYGYPAVIK